MNLQEKIQEMESKKSRNMDLDSFRKILDQKIPDHRKLPKIQVAGTNGKGSTSTWLSLLLEKSGLTVGLFTSPHLVVHNERIRIQKKMISDSDLERLYDQYRPLFLEKGFTMFEMDLFLALAYFLENQVDIAIIEVGLGGRLDASTALDYKATVLTNIGLEHTEILGDTLEQIAYEKSGIFKTGVLAVCGVEQPECQKVIDQRAREKRALLYYSYMPEVVQKGKKYFVYYLDGVLVFDKPYYQLKNFILACDTLYHLNFRLHYPLLQETIDDFHFSGRCMPLRKRPLVLVDGAHNVHGIQALVSSLKTWRGQIYFSVLKEKDAPLMIELLKTLKAPITLVDFESDRLYPLKNLGLLILSMDALKKRLQETHEPSLVCGSLYFVAEVMKQFNRS